MGNRFIEYQEIPIDYSLKSYLNEALSNVIDLTEDESTESTDETENEVYAIDLSPRNDSPELIIIHQDLNNAQLTSLSEANERTTTNSPNEIATGLFQDLGNQYSNDVLNAILTEKKLWKLIFSIREKHIHNYSVLTRIVFPLKYYKNHKFNNIIENFELISYRSFFSKISSYIVAHQDTHIIIMNDLNQGEDVTFKEYSAYETKIIIMTSANATIISFLGCNNCNSNSNANSSPDDNINPNTDNTDSNTNNSTGINTHNISGTNEVFPKTTNNTMQQSKNPIENIKFQNYENQVTPNVNIIMQDPEMIEQTPITLKTDELNNYSEVPIILENLLSPASNNTQHMQLSNDFMEENELNNYSEIPIMPENLKASNNSQYPISSKSVVDNIFKNQLNVTYIHSDENRIIPTNLSPNASNPIRNLSPNASNPIRNLSPVTSNNSEYIRPSEYFTDQIISNPLNSHSDQNLLTPENLLPSASENLRKISSKYLANLEIPYDESIISKRKQRLEQKSETFHVPEKKTIYHKTIEDLIRAAEHIKKYTETTNTYNMPVPSINNNYDIPVAPFNNSYDIPMTSINNSYLPVLPTSNANYNNLENDISTPNFLLNMSQSVTRKLYTPQQLSYTPQQLSYTPHLPYQHSPTPQQSPIKEKSATFHYNSPMSSFSSSQQYAATQYSTPQLYKRPHNSQSNSTNDYNAYINLKKRILKKKAIHNSSSLHLISDYGNQPIKPSPRRNKREIPDVNLIPVNLSKNRNLESKPKRKSKW